MRNRTIQCGAKSLTTFCSHLDSGKITRKNLADFVEGQSSSNEQRKIRLRLLLFHLLAIFKRMAFSQEQTLKSVHWKLFPLLRFPPSGTSQKSNRTFRGKTCRNRWLRLLTDKNLRLLWNWIREAATNGRKESKNWLRITVTRTRICPNLKYSWVSERHFRFPFFFDRK